MSTPSSGSSSSARASASATPRRPSASGLPISTVRALRSRSKVLRPTAARQVPRRKVTGGGFELGRAEIVRRRVDEVARERCTLRDAGQIIAVDPVGKLEANILCLCLTISGEAIAPEHEGKRGKTQIVWHI